jgi:hypothetical protein
MRRTLIAVALASSLGTSSTLNVLDPLWAALSTLWRGAPVTEGGCGADPFGRCKPLPAQLDEGCGMDPNGRCNTMPAQFDGGCGMDPFGHPKCS